ncbi:hypothetical protein C0992_008920, partial [Termitomyces sp. T32_za158]
DPDNTSISDENTAAHEVERLLQDLREEKRPLDNSEPSATDNELNLLNYKDFPQLRQACAALTVKSKDKKLDVVLHGRITGMVGVLNLYLDSELSYTWREASMLTAKAQGKGTHHARNLRTWIHQFLHDSTLPTHNRG